MFIPCNCLNPQNIRWQNSEYIYIYAWFSSGNIYSSGYMLKKKCEGVHWFLMFIGTFRSRLGLGCHNDDIKHKPIQEGRKASKEIQRLKPMKYECAGPIQNLSKHQLLPTEKSVLVKGLKFKCTNADQSLPTTHTTHATQTHPHHSRQGDVSCRNTAKKWKYIHPSCRQR